MFENNKKGWHGAYSLSGKLTAEFFDEILRKDLIFNRVNEKKLIVRDFFAPDPEINKYDYMNDDIKSFKIYNIEKKHFSESLSKINKENNEKKEQITDADISKNIQTFFHKNPEKEIDLAKIKIYKPKYNLIFSKTLTGVNWNKMKGRKKNLFNITKSINNNYNNYLDGKNEKYYLTSENKCLVNMDNYTKRGEFINLKNIRIRSDKSFNKNDIKINKESNNSISNQSNSKTFRNKNSKNSINNIYIFINNIKTQNLESRLNSSRKTNLLLKKSFSEKLTGPDFKKYLTREYFEKLRLKKGFEKNDYLLALSLNHNLVREKTISNIKLKHKKNKNKIKKFTGINSIDLIDQYKSLDKYNNHLKINTPNIELIPSRSYFENIKNNNIDKPSDHLSPSYSSFHKNSFNNIINLKLLNSNIFKKSGNTKIKRNLHKIKNKILFNDKTYGQLIQENILNKLDGVTLKTLK